MSPRASSHRPKAFALTVIDQTADMLYIGNFGFRTSSDYDKFAKYETRETALGMPYVPGARGGPV